MPLLRLFLPPTSPLHQHHHRIPLLALPILGFFPSLYLNLHHFLKCFYLGTPYLQRHHYTIPPRLPYAKRLTMAVPILLAPVRERIKTVVMLLFNTSGRYAAYDVVCEKHNLLESEVSMLKP